MTGITRDKFPPHEYTDDEKAAVAGRYVENAKRETPPDEGGRYGRTPPAPHGTVYVSDEP
jgi:hypothetical protein